LKRTWPLPFMARRLRTTGIYFFEHPKKGEDMISRLSTGYHILNIYVRMREKKRKKLTPTGAEVFTKMQAVTEVTVVAMGQGTPEAERTVQRSKLSE